MNDEVIKLQREWLKAVKANYEKKLDEKANWETKKGYVSTINDCLIAMNMLDLFIAVKYKRDLENQIKEQEEIAKEALNGPAKV